MVLTDEQCERFFDTMDALLYYVNERFQVVEGFTLDYDGQIGDMKTSIVAHALWDNVDVIDSFVAENPLRLSQKHLDAAIRWKSALPGLYTLVRYQGGRAILMNEAGVFSVSGVTLELEGEIGKAPAFVEMVLLPFDDAIIYDGFLQAYDAEGSAAEAARIQDEFENRCSKGIATTADEFVAVAEAYLEAAHNKELEALLQDVAREAAGEDEELPAGFHRGVLSGLDMLEREEVIAVEMARRSREVAGADKPGSDQPGSDQPGSNQPVSDQPRTHADVQADQAINCAIACVLARGVVAIDEAYDQYRALVSDPLNRADFSLLLHYEASFSDSYFGIWEHDGRDYLQYYTLTPDYIAQTASQIAVRSGNGETWHELREELEYYESYRSELLQTRREITPKPLSRTLLENTPLGELLRDESVMRLRRFFDERIPDGQDDYTFADLAAQEFALTSIEAGSTEELYRLAEDLGISGCCADEARLPRLATNVYNAMPSWENNGWSPQELYEQLTGRHVFYNDDGTIMKVGGDDLCPCGSGMKYRECHGK